jgi:hypothetical protein
MFPDGAPGVALVLLRVAVVLQLASLLPEIVDRAFDDGVLIALLCIPFAALLLGLCTPVAAAFGAFCGLVATTMDADIASVAAMSTSLALVLLGPGAYSIDARRYGRRRWSVAGRDGRDD